MLLSPQDQLIVRIASLVFIILQGTFLSAVWNKIDKEATSDGKIEKVIELIVFALIFLFVDIVLLIAFWKAL